MRPQDKHLGHATLQLLAEDWSIPLLGELTGGPLRPSELEERLPAAPHSAVMRRLRAMRVQGVVSREREPDLPPRALYGLTEAGRQLLRVPAAAERWDREWGHGAKALPTISDQPTRELLLAIGAGAGSHRDLHPKLFGSRRTQERRLAQMVQSRIILRRSREGSVLYELTDCARALALVAIAAARWAWEWMPPSEPVPTDDVAGVLHLFAPTAQLPDELGGVCRLRVAGQADVRDVYVAAHQGRMKALTGVASGGAHGSGVLCKHTRVVRRSLAPASMRDNSMRQCDSCRRHRHGSCGRTRHLNQSPPTWPS
jgi:DNA-binding HxlR family transcriptional regulator